MGLFKKNLGIFKINYPKVQVSYLYASLSPHSLQTNNWIPPKISWLKNNNNNNLLD